MTRFHFSSVAGRVCAVVGVNTALIAMLCSCSGTAQRQGDELGTSQMLSLHLIASSLLEIAFADDQVAGTAVSLAGGRLLTCRHVLPNDEYALIGDTYLVQLDGLPVKVEIEMLGDDATIAGDWVILTVPDHVKLQHEVTLETEWPLEVGEQIYLLGYPDVRAMADEWLNPRVCLVVATVDSLPSRWHDVPDSIVVVSTRLGEVYEGLSGGPAVVWDDGRGRFVMIGIYRGMRKWQAVGLTYSARHTVVRVPGEIAALNDGRDTSQSNAQ